MSQWTKKAIIECFNRQIEIMPLDRITVKGIVAECGVTRNTFYYHFEDIFALAKEVLRERLEQITLSAADTGDWETLLILLARQITQKDLEFYDYIYYMDSRNLTYLRRMFPDFHGFQPFLSREVADPWYSGDFTQTWADVQEGCQRILEELT